MKKLCELCGGSKLWRPVLAWWYSRVACPKCEERDAPTMKAVPAATPRDNSDTMRNIKKAQEIMAGANHYSACERLHRGEFRRMTGSGQVIVDSCLGVMA